jgi:lipoyl(octanoyl) transferase
VPRRTPRPAKYDRRWWRLTGTREAIPVLDLGLAPYMPVQDLQGRLRDAVVAGAIPGVLLLLEHEPVITLGSRAGDHDLRSSPGGAAPLAVVKSERGGQATLHAPGQLVSYPIVTVAGHDLRTYVDSLEETLLVLLADLDVVARRREGKPGLYVAEEKIASVGLRCRRWVASHGTSLNVSVDLSLFDQIISCGEPTLRQTSLEAVTGRRFTMAEMKTRYTDAVRKVFGWDLLPMRVTTFDRSERALGI